MTAYPSPFYRDPADIVDFNQQREIRELKGCAACKFAETVIFGKGLCGIGRKAGIRGYCEVWENA